MLREIQAEAEARREAGDIPVDVERQLDQLFWSLAPTPDGDLDAALDRAEEAGLIDLNPPLDSTNALYVPVKRAVHRLVLFYFDHVAQQVSAFADATARAGRMLAARMRLVEDRQATVEAGVGRLTAMVEGGAERSALAARHAPDRTAEWGDALVALFSGVTGRVLHAEAGQGRLLAILTGAGVDAYGCDPAGGEGEVEVRPDPVLEHLGRVADGALAGVVLSGCVDRLAVPDLLTLAGEAARVLEPGGRLAVVSATELTPVEADLAVGHPLHPDTWSALLGDHGFTDVKVDPASGSYLLTAAR